MLVQDTSGTIGAGVHSSVFQAEEGVSVGAVLMLEEVCKMNEDASRNGACVCILDTMLIQQSSFAAGATAGTVKDAQVLVHHSREYRSGMSSLLISDCHVQMLNRCTFNAGHQVLMT